MSRSTTTSSSFVLGLFLRFHGGLYLCGLCLFRGGCMSRSGCGLGFRFGFRRVVGFALRCFGWSGSLCGSFALRLGCLFLSCCDFHLLFGFVGSVSCSCSVGFGIVVGLRLGLFAGGLGRVLFLFSKATATAASAAATTTAAAALFPVGLFFCRGGIRNGFALGLSFLRPGFLLSIILAGCFGLFYGLFCRLVGNLRFLCDIRSLCHFNTWIRSSDTLLL
mmetsp:Transcript_28287/g.66410  ORF Transcript_28287/g.66410 Transcript_28287/m.66410 type:complete len:220 (-) Transcript_28287:221-880(-)